MAPLRAALLPLLLATGSLAPAQEWTDRTERPVYNTTLWPHGGPEGGPLAVRYRRVLRWTGDGWSHLSDLPPACIGVVGAAFDRARDRVVALMLTDLASNTVETFEFAPSGWRQIPTSPPGGGVLVFDPATNQLLALTRDLNLRTTQDYSWDGATWTPLPADIRPYGTLFLTIEDLGRGRLVGLTTTAGAQPSQTYEWDGTSWTLRTPLNSPPPRNHGRIAYDRAAGRVTLFGDLTSGTDTWTWDGTDWQQVVTPTTPQVDSGVILTFDPVSGTLLLLGGIGSDSGYRFTGADWQPLPPAPIGGLVQVANDPVRGVLVRHQGGLGTLEWDGVTWTQRSAGGPSRRSAPMTYDISTASVLVFGGSSFALNPLPVLTILGDTWTFDGVQWAQRTPAASPPARNNHALVSHAASGGSVLFGGSDTNGQPLGDTWIWAGNTWTDVSATLTMTPAAGLVRGANGALGSDPLVLADGTLWRWSGSWSVVDNTLPPLSNAAVGVTATGNALLVGGGPNGIETHELVAGAWLQRGDGLAWIDTMAFDPLHGSVQGFDRGDRYAFSATLAATESVGPGCGQPAPELFADGDPVVGDATFQLHTDETSGVAIFTMDLTSGSIAMGPNCTRYLQSPVSVGLGVTNAFGVASLRAPLPANPALAGVTVYAQAVTPQPNGPLGGLALSNGLEIAIGH